MLSPQLSPQETERFYRIWFPLISFVNEQRQLAPGFPAAPRTASVPVEDVQRIRNALWDDDALLERFTEHNPAGLSADDLAIATSWKHRVAGQFFVVRYLKKHTIFLTETPAPRAYGVLGLVSTIEDILGSSLPIYVQAVLLPFGDHIIFDSVLVGYPVVFGPGTRHDLQQTLRDVQEREGVITSLPWQPDSEELRKRLAVGNSQVLRAFRQAVGRAPMSPATAEAHVATIADLAGMLLAEEPPSGLLELMPEDLQQYLQHLADVTPRQRAREKAAVTSFRRFVRFLFESMRIDYDQAAELRGFLKHPGAGTAE